MTNLVKQLLSRCAEVALTWQASIGAVFGLALIGTLTLLMSRFN